MSLSSMFTPSDDPLADGTTRERKFSPPSPQDTALTRPMDGEYPADPPSVSQSASARGYSLPTDIATLHSIINTLLELQATNSANAHLAACLARLRTEPAPPSPTITTTTTTTPTPTTTTPSTPTLPTTPTPAPVPCQHPKHTLTTVSGRGAASPEVFEQITKRNWHGRLGRAHMVDVDALSPTALTELDCFLRRKLHATFPRGEKYSALDADGVFASLAVLGLRLEDRGAYADVPDTDPIALHDAPMTRRGRDMAAWYYAHGKYVDYWRGSAVETLVELARYRGLFDDEGYLRVE